MIFLKAAAGFIIGRHFGNMAKDKTISFGTGLVLTVSLTLIVCMTIDWIAV